MYDNHGSLYPAHHPHCPLQSLLLHCTYKCNRCREYIVSLQIEPVGHSSVTLVCSKQMVLMKLKVFTNEPVYKERVTTFIVHQLEPFLAVFKAYFHLIPEYDANPFIKWSSWPSPFTHIWQMRYMQLLPVAHSWFGGPSFPLYNSALWLILAWIPAP